MIRSFEVDELTKRIGRLMKFWGLKEVHGRVWALIYLSEILLNSPVIMKTLRLSKSATNMALSELKQYELIDYAGIEDTRHKLYRTELSLDEVLARIFSEKNSSLVAEIKESISVVQSLAGAEKSGLNPKRVADLLQSSLSISNSRNLNTEV